MHLDQRSQKYVVIGTLVGYAYNCSGDNVKTFEGSTDGIWNKVSNWVTFIKGQMAKLGEKTC